MLFYCCSSKQLTFSGLDFQTTIGGKEKGFQDGNLQDARFNSPQGVASHGKILFVADTENHALRQVILLHVFLLLQVFDVLPLCSLTQSFSDETRVRALYPVIYSCFPEFVRVHLYTQNPLPFTVRNG